MAIVVITTGMGGAVRGMSIGSAGGIGGDGFGVMRRWTMSDLHRECGDIEILGYLDGRSIARPKHGASDRAWKWDGEGWVVATADDLRPSVDRPR